MRITSEQAMYDLGSHLGSLFVGGEALELVGDVGAGKTTLTKGLAQGLRVNESVQSPSFTISRVYDGRDGLRLEHYDFYRLSDPGIMKDELAESVADDKTVVVVEWGASVTDVLPADRLVVGIVSPGEFEREVTLHATGSKSQAILKELYEITN